MKDFSGIRRLHLFEFEDLSWFPDIIRRGGTDYLRYFLIRSHLYRPAAGLILKTLKKTGHDRIIDLCSGGVGIWRSYSVRLGGEASGAPVAG